MRDEQRDQEEEPEIAMDPEEYRRRIGDQDGSSLAQRQQANLRPEVASLTHGVYLRDGVCMSCDQCAAAQMCEHHHAGKRCAIEGAFIAQRRPRLMRALAESGFEPELHEALIDSAIWAELRLQRAIRFVAAGREFRYSKAEGDTYSGVAKAIPTLQGAHIRALEALNLTPAAMAKLRAQEAAGRAGASALAIAVHRQEEESEDADRAV